MNVPLLPHFVVNPVVSDREEDVLVVASVEDADLAATRGVCVDTPEEVVVALLVSWGLERDNGDALWVKVAEDVVHNTILATGIHCLKHNKHGILVLSAQDVLQLADSMMREGE